MKKLHPTRKTRVFQEFSNFCSPLPSSSPLPTLPSQHYTGMIDIVEGEPSPRASPNPEASPPSNDLDGGEIYDRLIQKGAKLGTQANKVIRRLKKRGRFAEDGALAKSEGAPTSSFPLKRRSLSTQLKRLSPSSSAASRAREPVRSRVGGG